MLEALSGREALVLASQGSLWTVHTVDQHQKIVSIAVALLLGCVSRYIVYRSVYIKQPSSPSLKGVIQDSRSFMPL